MCRRCKCSILPVCWVRILNMFELLILLIADLIVDLCRRYKSYQLAERSRIIQFVTVTSNFHLSQLSVLPTSYSDHFSVGWLLSKYPPHMINWSKASSGFCQSVYLYILTVMCNCCINTNTHRKYQLRQGRDRRFQPTVESWLSHSEHVHHYTIIILIQKIKHELLSQGLLSLTYKSSKLSSDLDLMGGWGVGDRRLER